MSTRCLTIFYDTNDEEIAVLYRHMDGYINGHGVELANFLRGKRIVNGISLGDDGSDIFNGMGCLAASVVSHFKKGAGMFYLHPAGTRNIGEDYTYHVSGSGQEPVMRVDDGVFVNASDFIEFYKDKGSE